MDCKYADYLEKVINPKSLLIKFNSLPPLNFFEKNNNIVLGKEKCLLVFDITPVSLVNYPLLFPIPIYRTSETAINFLEDITKVSELLKS